MSEGGEGPIATAGQVKSLIRRKNRKHPAHEEQSLNIYPMMDMMTILLVFLIMQFAQQSANIVQSDDLVMPFSTSHEEVEQGEVALLISRSEILVDGVSALTLRNGLVDPSQKVGGANGFLITPLNNVMREHRERARNLEAAGGTPFTGTVSIIVDGRTPFRTLAEVIYTIGQNEFQNIHFVAVEDASHNRDSGGAEGGGG